jgi:hypothetical protein
MSEGGEEKMIPQVNQNGPPIQNSFSVLSVFLQTGLFFGPFGWPKGSG